MMLPAIAERRRDRLAMARLGHAPLREVHGHTRAGALLWKSMVAQETTRTEAPQHAEAVSRASASETPAGLAGPAAVRLAFLLSRYPAVSHTFLLHEVAGLRACGFAIATASINDPDRPLSKLPEAEAAEAARTFYVKSGKAAALLAILQTVVTRPAVVARGLLAVLRLPGLSLRARGLWLFYLAEALLVGRWMRRERLPHLHVHFGGPVASVGMLASIAWKLPFSLTIHGPEELLNVDRHHLRDKLRQASFVLCISDFCRSQLCALTPPEEWSKFTVVRLGVDPVLLQPAVRGITADRAPAADLRLVCTGRLVPEKGQRILLETLLHLRDRGVRVHATLIGAGPEAGGLREFVADHGLADSVDFTGALAHAATLDRVRSADIFVLPSFAEGVPVALMEAMAFAVPCVSTTIAGIPELIETGRSGLLVPPANVEALANAIASLAAEPALRLYLGASGRERIVRNYNLPLNHERLAASFTAELTRPAHLADSAKEEPK